MLYDSLGHVVNVPVPPIAAVGPPSKAFNDHLLEMAFRLSCVSHFVHSVADG